MAQDETEFDKLLKEAREWEARDRARHKPFAMKEDGDARPFPPASRAPAVTVEELEKKTAADLQPPKREAPPKAQAPRVEMQKPAAAIKAAFETVVKQAQAQRAADRAKAPERAKRKGGWGSLIWVLILLYFIFKHFLHWR